MFFHRVLLTKRHYGHRRILYRCFVSAIYLGYRTYMKYRLSQFFCLARHN